MHSSLQERRTILIDRRDLLKAGVGLTVSTLILSDIVESKEIPLSDVNVSLIGIRKEVENVIKMLKGSLDLNSIRYAIIESDDIAIDERSCKWIRFPSHYVRNPTDGNRVRHNTNLQDDLKQFMENSNVLIVITDMGYKTDYPNIDLDTMIYAVAKELGLKNIIFIDSMKISNDDYSLVIQSCKRASNLQIEKLINL